MSIADEHYTNISSPISVTSPTLKMRELKILVREEDDGLGYYAIAVRLAGVYGQGSTIEEAIQDCKDSFVSTIEYYSEYKEEIPWRDEAEVLAQGGFERWVVVNV